ncbi:16131_t:CDS:2 [Rhizophagus irregularis]|nr:16131_t:CDS:2 [Rhizophagus irregularis]
MKSKPLKISFFTRKGIDIPKNLNKSRTEMKKNAKRDLHCTCIG